MGNKAEKGVSRQARIIKRSFTNAISFLKELSPECIARVEAVFGIFDVDGSNEIDKAEALNHWKSAFGKISAKEFFNTVDVNNDGVISKEEFLGFWEVVKGAGHDEDEIMEELSKIEKGESWCGFDNLPKKYNPASKEKAAGSKVD